MTDQPAWTWVWPTFDVSLHVTRDAADRLSSFRQENGGNERGGQLFVDLKRPDGLWLVEVTPPHISDKAGPTWFEMNAARCQQEIIFANDRGLRLIGYWHSHPETVPNLSSQDHKSLRNFRKRNKYQLPNPLAIIVGRCITPNGIRAWSYRATGVVLADVQLAEDS